MGRKHKADDESPANVTTTETKTRNFVEECFALGFNSLMCFLGQKMFRFLFAHMELSGSAEEQ